VSTKHSTLPLGADAALISPRHGSHSSHTARHSRRSSRSSMAVEILGFTKGVTDSLLKMTDELRADAVRRDEIARAREQEANAREQNLMRDAARRDELAHSDKQILVQDAVRREQNLAKEAARREEILCNAKSEVEQAALQREQAALQREQNIVQAELKRKEIETAAANEIQKQQMDVNLKIQISQIEAAERRECEFQQEKQKEKEIMAKEFNARMQVEKQLAEEKQKVIRLQYEAKLKERQQRLPITKETTCEVTSLGITSGPPSMYTQCRLEVQPPTVTPPLLSARQLGVYIPPLPPRPAVMSTLPILTSAITVPQLTTGHAALAKQDTIPASQLGISATSVAPSAPQPMQASILVPNSNLGSFASIDCVANTNCLSVANAVVNTADNVANATSVSVSGLSGVGASSSAPSSITVSAARTSYSQTVEAAAPTPKTEHITNTTTSQTKSNKVEVAPPPPVPAPTVSQSVVVVKQPQPTKPYSGQSSHKKYREYFTRLAQCNGWVTDMEKAQNLLVALEGAAAEAVRGLTVTKDSDYEEIWEALKRRFGHMDEPERAMTLFDLAKQNEMVDIASFEQNLRSLYREAWPDSDIKSKDADALLQRRFVGGVHDAGLQQYLRLHARSDDFNTTVEKARQYMHTQNLIRATKKPAVKIASDPEPDRQDQIQPILDGLQQVLQTVLENRQTETRSDSNSGNRGRQSNRQNSPAPSNSSAGSQGDRRSVRFQDDERDSRSGNGERRNNNGSNNRNPRSQSADSSRSGNSGRNYNNNNRGQARPGFQTEAQDRQSGWRQAPTENSDRRPLQNWGNRDGQQRPPPRSSGSRPSGQENRPPQGRRGCYICGQPGCHSDLHTDEPRAPPPNRNGGPFNRQWNNSNSNLSPTENLPYRGSAGCWICGEPDHWTRTHNQVVGDNRPSRPQNSENDMRSNAGSQSNSQRGPRQGDRTPPAPSSSRPQTN